MNVPPISTARRALAYQLSSILMLPLATTSPQVLKSRCRKATYSARGIVAGCRPASSYFAFTTRIGHHLQDGGGQHGHHRLGRLGRRGDRVPVLRLVARHRFGERRRIGQHRPARRRGHRHGARLAALDQAQGGGIAEIGVDDAGGEVVQRRAGAAIGHVHHLQARHLGEELARQMLAGADAARGPADLRLLRELHELRQRLGRQVVAHGHDERHAHQARDVRQRHRIVGHLAQMRPGGERADAGQRQGVAVGRRVRHRLDADDAAGAALVLDDDGLAELLRQRLHQEPRRQVDAAAGREGHDDLDRTAGKILCCGGTRRREDRQRKRSNQQASTSVTQNKPLSAPRLRP